MDAASSTSATSSPDLPVGQPPGIPYVAGNRYVTPGGQVFPLPMTKGGISGVTSFSGGLLVSDAAYFEGTNGIDLVKQGVRVESWPSSSHCSSGRPVASADGDHVAWVTVRCPETVDESISAVHVARADGSAEAIEPVGPGLVSVVGFLNRSVVYNVGFRGGARITDFDDRPRLIPGVDRVRAVSHTAQMLIGQVDDHARLLIDLGGHVRWRARTGDLISFSPDGTKVLSILGQLQMSVLHSQDGRPAASVDLPAGAEVWSTVWETNQTLLTLLRHDGGVAVVRVFLDGRIERATPTVAAGDSRQSASAWRLLPH